MTADWQLQRLSTVKQYIQCLIKPPNTWYNFITSRLNNLKNYHRKTESRLRLDREALCLLTRSANRHKLGKIIFLMEALYTHTVSCVRVDRPPSELFHVRGGVRQGCVIAPYLFLTPMDTELWSEQYTRAMRALVWGTRISPTWTISTMWVCLLLC